MSTKYPGGLITKNPVTPAGPYQDGAAPGVWTVEQALQYTKQGIWPTAGNVPNYIEDVFSTYLYTGNGTSQSIVNGINVSTYGGMTWIKNRSTDTGLSVVHDTVRGTTQRLSTNLTSAQVNLTGGIGLTAFNSNGFTVGTGTAYNGSGNNLVSWTFREQPNFFDVVTYTGDGTSGRTVAHNLGSVPGFIVVKATSSSGNWAAAARKSDGTYAYGATSYAFGFNTTEQATSRSVSGLATSTTFTPDAIADVGTCNNTGVTYVAYLFAHNAGGFGLTGSDNVISCSSFTTDSSSNATITLGYEPQLVITKKVSGTGGPWGMYDNMRGWSLTAQNYLLANDSGAEGVINATGFAPNATGFTTSSPFDASSTYIYIAIRRGPMKVPTSGTTVFYPQARTANGAITSITGIGFPPDMVWSQRRDASGNSPSSIDKLRGPKQVLLQNSIGSELTSGSTYDVSSFDQDGVTVQAQGQNSVINYLTAQDANWYFKRAPSFFDEVCYTGTDAVRTINHNLGVAPELIIVKGRNTNPANSSYWTVYAQPTGNTNYMYLDSTNATSAFSGYWNNTSPTASVFTLGTGNGEDTNATGKNYVAYLFATCAGVSKVGSYTGNGSTQTINCGFTGGARFVLIKRTDDAGDWYVYDTARGMTTLTDPYLRLNTTTAEFATLGSVTTVSTGFAVNASILAAINTNAASYIFLAIA